jgi:hypothetical protein
MALGTEDWYSHDYLGRLENGEQLVGNMQILGPPLATAACLASATLRRCVHKENAEKPTVLDDYLLGPSAHSSEVYNL